LNDLNGPEKYFLNPGYLYVSMEQTLIATVLGSCISICLWDKKNRFGGMNHFIYPQGNKYKQNCKYGDVASEHLIRLMRKMGSDKKDLIAHIVGGANNPIFESNIGKMNFKIAQKVLHKADIKIGIKEVGGTEGRKLIFNTVTGDVNILKGTRVREVDWYK